MSVLQSFGLFKPNRPKKIVKQENGWYPDKTFAHVLKQERLKCDRGGSPVSYIVFDLSLPFNMIFRKKLQRIWDEFIILIEENTCGYDIKHITNSQSIGILTHDTSLNDAKLFIERISDKLHHRFEEQNLFEVSNLIRSIKISSYPVDQLAGNKNELQGRPIIINNICFDVCSEVNNSDKTILYLQKQILMEWKMSGRSKAMFD